jgi:hypothetical protein
MLSDVNTVQEKPLDELCVALAAIFDFRLIEKLHKVYRIQNK